MNPGIPKLTPSEYGFSCASEKLLYLISVELAQMAKNLSRAPAVASSAKKALRIFLKANFHIGGA